MAILVGPCGWSYDDWAGTVYPKSLEDKDRLGFIAETFPTVEVDSTFYRDPAPGIVKGWIAKTKALPFFELSVKAPEDLTHDLMVNADPDACARRVAAWRALVADPLFAAERLGAVLLQLSPAVTHAREMQARLDATLRALQGVPVAVEFRNRTWHTDDASAIKADALAMLDAHKAACVATDGPGFPPIVAPDAATHAYVRFHGRNREAWFKRGASRDERYDWDYTEEELRPWSERVAAMAKEKRLVRVYFNNHVGGQAFRNGHAFEDMLERAQAPIARQRGPQQRLF